MTPKEQQIVAELHSKVLAQSFVETDVVALLILLRDHVGDGPARELAQHIAHSNRNQGALFRHAFDNKRVLDRLGRKEGIVYGQAVITAEDFRKSINRALDRIRLTALDDVTSDIVLLCAMSLLQGGTVSNGKSSGKLSLVLTAAQFELRATIPIKYQGKEVPVSMSVVSVPNRWIPVCNPRAPVEPIRLVRVRAEVGHPLIEGFKRFEVQIERTPPISEADLSAALNADRRLVRSDEKTIIATCNDKTEFSLRWDGQRLTVDGLPHLFKDGTEPAGLLAALSKRLGACVHDDANAHWFLTHLSLGPPIPDDGFNCKWIGNAGPTCNRPL
jgi:hypothetical protein